MPNIFSTVDISQTSSQNKSHDNKLRNFLGNYGLAIVFVAFFVFMMLTSDSFFTASNLTNIVLQSSVLGLIAIGQTLVMILGGIDLSIGSFIAIAGAVAAVMAKSDFNGWWIPLLAGLLTGLVFGICNSFLIIKGKIAPFLATLATMTVVRGIALIYTKGYPIADLNNSFLFIGQGQVGFIPVAIIIFVVVAILFDFMLSKTQLGRHIYALGGNEESSRIVGIRISRIKLIVYTVSGLLAGLAGIVLTSRVNAADPLAGMSYELDAVTAAVIGGTSLTGGYGTIRGAMLGVMFIGIVSNGLDLMNVSSYYQQIVKGSILVVAVLLDRWKSK